MLTPGPGADNRRWMELGVVAFGGTSVLDVRCLGALRPEFAGAAARPIVEQPLGAAALGFGECSDRDLSSQVLQVILRPT